MLVAVGKMRNVILHKERMYENEMYYRAGGKCESEMYYKGRREVHYHQGRYWQYENVLEKYRYW